MVSVVTHHRFMWNKIRYIFKIVLLKKEALSFILRLLNTLCQLNWWTALLISSVFPCPEWHISRSQGDGKLIFKLNFEYTIWWWQFGCKDGWTPESTTKFGYDVKMRSIQDEEFSKTCVGSFMIWWSPNCEVRNSIFAPSQVVLSLIYQLLDFILKSPSTTVKSELDSARVSRVSSKLSVNFSKSSLVWLGKIDKEKQIYIFLRQLVIQNLYFLVSNGHLVFSVEGNFWYRYIHHPFYVVMGGSD